MSNLRSFRVMSVRTCAVLVSKMDIESKCSRTVTSLRAGDSFGELGVLKAAPRSATIISRETIELLVFTKEVCV